MESNSNPNIIHTALINQKKAQRYDSLDVFRGLCIFFMIFNHSFLFLSNSTENDLISFLIIDGLTIFFSASSFLTIAGISNGLSMLNRAKNKNPTTYKHYFLRGVFMIFFGLYLCFIGQIVSGKSEYFNMDILYLTGFISFILPLLNCFSNEALISTSVFIAICTPLIRRDTTFNIRWKGIEEIQFITKVFKNPFWATFKGGYTWNKDIESVFEGLIYFGYFPIFPFSIFFLIGIYISRKLFNNEFKENINFFLFIGFLFLIFGLTLGVVGGLIKNSLSNLHKWYASVLIYYPVSFSHLMCQVGSILIFIVVFHQIFDSKYYDFFFLKYIRITGQFSLTYYCYSYTIIYGTCYIYHLITSIPLKNIYSNLLKGHWPIAYAFCCWSFLSFIFMPICLKYDGVGTLEHLLGLSQNLGSNKNDLVVSSNSVIKKSILI